MNRDDSEYPMKLDKDALKALSKFNYMPEVDVITKALKEHGKMTEGRCWMDLTTLTLKPNAKGSWPIVKVIRDRYSNSLNLDVRFHVLLIAPWMVHIEMTEEEGWTAEEVLSLPDWFMIGGTFEEDGLSHGYSQEFLNRIMTIALTGPAGSSTCTVSKKEGTPNSTFGLRLLTTSR